MGKLLAFLFLSRIVQGIYLFIPITLAMLPQNKLAVWLCEDFVCSLYACGAPRGSWASSYNQKMNWLN